MPTLAPDTLERLLHALDALHDVAEQKGPEVSAVRADAASALSLLHLALADFHAELEQELAARHPVVNCFSALLMDYARRCSAHQRADVARLVKLAEQPEVGLSDVLLAASALTLVLRVEALQLAHDVRL